MKDRNQKRSPTARFFLSLLAVLFDIFNINTSYFDTKRQHKKLGYCMGYAYQFRLVVITSFVKSRLFNKEDLHRFITPVKKNFIVFAGSYASMNILFSFLQIIKAIFLFILFFGFPFMFFKLTGIEIRSHGISFLHFYTISFLILLLTVPEAPLLIFIQLSIYSKKLRRYHPGIKWTSVFIDTIKNFFTKVLLILFIPLAAAFIFFDKEIIRFPGWLFFLICLTCVSAVVVAKAVFILIYRAVRKLFLHKIRSNSESSISSLLLFLIWYLNNVYDGLDELKRRKSINTLIDELAVIFETYLYKKVSAIHRPSENLVKEKFKKIAEGFRRYKLEVSFSDKEGLNKILQDIGKIYLSFLLYKWDDLPQSPIIPEVTEKRIVTVKRSLSTLIIAVIPLSAVLLVQYKIQELSKEKFEYGLLISCLWLAFTVINFFDPTLSNKVSAVKDIKDMTLGKIV